MLEFNSLRPLCCLCSPNNCPQTAPNITGLGIPRGLLHFHCLLLCGFLFSAHSCFITHLSLLLASSTGQLLGILALFTREKSTISTLKSPRDPRVAKVLVRMECWILMAMLVMQVGVFALTCAVQSCWVREFEGVEAEREAAAARRRSRRIARVQEESMANAAKIAEVKAKELDEEMKNKYGQWVKTDFES